MRRLAAILLATTATVAPPSAQADADAVPSGVEVTYLANEGLLLRGGGLSIVIDAFVPTPAFGYDAIPPALWREMLDRQPPFEHVDLALVSHNHFDHFQPAAARAFLVAHPETTLVASAEVVHELRNGWNGWPAVAERVVERTPTRGAPLRYTLPGLEVELHLLPHGSARTLPLNLAHVLHLGGRTLLHAGDAEASADDVRAAGLDDRKIDVSLLPFWFWTPPYGDALSALAGDANVAIHLSGADLAEHGDRLPQAEPPATAFRSAMEMRRF